MALSILYRFRDKAKYWPKIVIFYTVCIGRPLGVPVGKTEVVWLPDGEKVLMTRLAVSIAHRCVTDRQTDGRTSTSCDCIVRAMHSTVR